MLRTLYCIGLLSLVSSSLGCAICCSPDDCNYGAYGGRWQRHDLSSGRVGSVFAEAGYDSMGDAIDAEPATVRGPAPASESEPADQPVPRPGDDYIRPASYDEASSDEMAAFIE